MSVYDKMSVWLNHWYILRRMWILTRIILIMTITVLGHTNECYDRSGNMILIMCYNVKLPIFYQNFNGYGQRQKVMIQNSNIPIVPSSAFTQLRSPYLISISMENVGIKSIIPGVFNMIENLQEIFLSENELTNIQNGVFSSLEKLTTLDLSQNRIQHLDPNWLENTNTLKYLDLSSNELQSIDYGMLIFKNSIYLNISYNKIVTFNFEGIQESISVLDLSNNEILYISGCFHDVKTLNLSNNFLQSLNQTNYCSYSKISQLDISFNNISVLDSQEFENFENLSSLCLQGNGIKTIPNEVFSKLTALVSLNISNNSVSEFHYGLFDHLNSLQILDLSRNNISSLGRYLHALDQLAILDISYNRISKKDSIESSLNLPALEKISIDHNQFSCDSIIQISDLLRTRNIRLVPGNSKNTPNVLGIACSDQSHELGEEFKELVSNKIDQLFDNDFRKSLMHEYFNKDFENSNFYRYLQNLSIITATNTLTLNKTELFMYFDKGFKDSGFYKYLESFKQGNFTDREFNRSLVKFFEYDFKNSTFVQYLESIGKRNNCSNRITYNSMDNYLNDGFEQSKFYKYLENFKSLEVILKEYHARKDNDVDKIISLHNVNGSNSLLTTIIVLLLFITIIMTLNTYRRCILRNMNKTKEQIELLQV